MVPVLLLLGGWLAARIAGRLVVSGLDSWAASGRLALTATFVFTGLTHFTEMQHDYLAMVPEALPGGVWLIYLTGGLELLGATALLVPSTRRWAGAGLMVLLVLMFPANVNAALNEIPFRGQPPTPLMVRTAIQVLFLAALWWSAVRVERRRG